MTDSTQSSHKPSRGKHGWTVPCTTSRPFVLLLTSATGQFSLLPVLHKLHAGVMSQPAFENSSFLTGGFSDPEHSKFNGTKQQLFCSIHKFHESETQTRQSRDGLSLLRDA